jgi:outer membrane protein, heavy metal efflux system
MDSEYKHRRGWSCVGATSALGIALLCHSCLGLSQSARQSTPLSEREAVQLALSRPAVQAMVEGRQGIAQSAVLEARTWPNPVVAYERQRLSGSLFDDDERIVSLSQRFDISGKRQLNVRAAQTRLQASAADVESRRQELAFEVRRRFYEAFAASKTLQALRRWEERLLAAERLAATLQKGGEVSGYDRRRTSHERASTLARVGTAGAEVLRVKERLRGLTGASEDQLALLQGVLLPEDSAPLEQLLTRLRERPDLQSLVLKARAFQLDERVARRAWIPDLTLSAGVRQIDSGPQNDSGPVFGISIPLPLFERGQAAQRRAYAEARLASAESELALQRAEGEIRGSWEQFRQLSAAASEFRRHAVDGAQRLAAIAEAAYRGGERGILELLDAYRAVADADVRLVELELAARAAQLELEYSAGWSLK